MSTSHRNPPTPDEPRDAHKRYPDRPWIQNGIDYGPAIVAMPELAAWTFDVAERDVRGWPEGERRIATARRFVRARIRGTRARRVPFEDVVFTARLLARVFDNELALTTSDIVTIFDVLGLPTEVVPFTPPRTPAASAVRAARPLAVGDLDPFLSPRLRNAA